MVLNFSAPLSHIFRIYIHLPIPIDQKVDKSQHPKLSQPAWMGLGMPRRSSSRLMESPMPPWMQRISPAETTPEAIDRYNL